MRVRPAARHAGRKRRPHLFPLDHFRTIIPGGAVPLRSPLGGTVLVLGDELGTTSMLYVRLVSGWFA